MKEAPNQKVQEKKPLLKFKNTKKYKNLEKQFSSPTPISHILTFNFEWLSGQSRLLSNRASN